jgi:hypothetical protein
MRRNDFWFVLLITPGTLRAQQIPARELLEFPLGSLAEGPAASFATRDGFRNPAAVLLPDSARMRFSVSSLTTGTQQGVSGQILAVSAAAPRGITAALSIARAEVAGISPTDGNPEAIGGDLQYNMLVVSGIAARRYSPNLTAALALRYQTGQVDVTREGALGIDAGVIFAHLGRVDGRVSASSFLWRPGTQSGEGAAFTAAGDARFLGADSLREARVGYSYSNAPGLSREHYFSATGRYRRWEARAGVAQGTVSSQTSTRVRLALGWRYTDYFIGVAREDTPDGFSPVYHFTFVATIPR